MAKRKRLEVPTDAVSPDLETKSAFPPAPRARMPIAEVASEVAGRAALEEVAGEMARAEREGRVIKSLRLDEVAVLHLNRDRLDLDPDDLEVLKASIKDRGQQTPIEVVRLGNGYGLISGLRRMEALKALGETHVLALVKAPKDQAAAYQAMVEENEIRADLSFYERANIAFLCVGQNVYRDPRTAVGALFAHATASKRSKILKFVTIRETLGKALTFPTAIPEKLGLQLAAAIEADKRVATRLADALRKTPPQDAAAERRTLERALKGTPAAKAKRTDDLVPGVQLQAAKGRAVLSGAGVDQPLLDDLRDWLVSRAKS